MEEREGERERRKGMKKKKLSSTLNQRRSGLHLPHHARGVEIFQKPLWKAVFGGRTAQHAPPKLHEAFFLIILNIYTLE
jgi:hypothetical protein